MATHWRTVLLAAAVATTLVTYRCAIASDGKQVTHIGFIANSSLQRNPQLKFFWDGLRDLGYVEGKNIAIDYRWAQGDLSETPDIARELVRQGVDLIVTWGTPATAAAQKATTEVPIVFVAVADPVGAGLVASLARPGGNITGASNAMVAIGGKWVELMMETVPDLKSVAVLRNPINAGSTAWAREAEQTAQALGLAAIVLDAGSPEGIDRAFDTIERKGAGALVITGDPFFAGERKRLAELSTRHRLPSLFVGSVYPDAGGLMSYGMDVKVMFRRAAALAARILKGDKPAALPVERPTVFRLVINLKTANAIGLDVPQSLRLKADRLIE